MRCAFAFCNWPWMIWRRRVNSGGTLASNLWRTRCKRECKATRDNNHVNNLARLRMKLRIYADFNSVGDGDGAWCWCLRYNDRLLNEVAAELHLSEGQSVIVYYDDPAEEFE